MDGALKHELTSFIQNPGFPCIMAKAVARSGHLETHMVVGSDKTASSLNVLGDFVNHYRTHPEKLSSCFLAFPDFVGKTFEEFEIFFWSFLRGMRILDEVEHDKRVSSHPQSPQFSFSVFGEAFFILLLHPQSPRIARRFRIPSIVFNPHEQFEALRKKGVFEKIRTFIRRKDQELQPEINPMLSDFGEVPEVFQYTGRTYEAGAPNPLSA